MTLTAAGIAYPIKYRAGAWNGTLRETYVDDSAGTIIPGKKDLQQKNERLLHFSNHETKSERNEEGDRGGCRVHRY